jgi:hypothetical protein
MTGVVQSEVDLRSPPLKEVQMNVDVVGRVNNLVLPKTKGLLPVQEAVINCIEACSAIKNGAVQIVIDRDTSQKVLEDDRAVYPVQSFHIIDNGPGFDEQNYQSFITSDTTLKAEFGGKGIGRFLWLKAFEIVRIQSNYSQDGNWRLRSFDFELTQSAIANYRDATSRIVQPRTEVTLSRPRLKYQQYIPKKATIIAQKLLEHCLSFFIMGTVPSVTVSDTMDEEVISLNDLYASNIKENIRSTPLSLREVPIQLDLILYPTSSETTHRVFYCAHSREVRTENLADSIPLLSKRLWDGSGEFVFMAYVSSPYLDETVNQERTGFAYEPESDDEHELEFADVVSFREIRQLIIGHIRNAANEYLEPIRQEHRKRITEFVRSKNPEYRHIVKYRASDIDEIPPGTSDDKLELALHQIGQSMEREVKEKSIELLKSGVEDISDLDQFKQKYNEVVEKITDIGQASLSRYVVHRRMILSLLESRLAIKDSGRYSLEESIHEIVFPLRTTSDDTEYIKQNLWIIDEKLSYHFFLASDQPLTAIPVTSSESKLRPDLLIFNKPLAFTEDDPPYSSIVVVEFKRPVRDDYTDADNPVTQVMRYVTEIRDKKVRDKNGRFIDVDPNTPFYAYIVCDVTRKLQEIVTYHGFYRTPDFGGFYWFNQNIKTYIEIISFDKLLADAKKRNRVLFERLGLPANA